MIQFSLSMGLELGQVIFLRFLELPIPVAFGFVYKLPVVTSHQCSGIWR